MHPSLMLALRIDLFTASCSQLLVSKRKCVIIVTCTLLIQETFCHSGYFDAYHYYYSNSFSSLSIYHESVSHMVGSSVSQYQARYPVMWDFR